MRESKIGGQAVIEGVMMRGETSAAVAVRDEKKRIRIKAWRLAPRKKISKIPFLRGMFNFASSMSTGMKTLMDSAEVFGEEEPTKFEKWVAKTLKVDLLQIVIGFSAILGIALAVGLFIIAPSYLSKWTIEGFKWSNSVRSLVEGGYRLIIFVLYILLTMCSKDVMRVYRYHGAEHKTINCFEHEDELTVENVMKHGTYHNRCGTSFLFFVILLSIIIFAFFEFESEWVRLLVRLACIPVIVSLAYELIMFLADHKSKFWEPLRLPGRLVQKLTVQKPSEDMVEVAIAAFRAVEEMDANPDMAEYDHLTYKYYLDVKREAEKLLLKGHASFDADVEWIAAEVLNVKRSELRDGLEVKAEDYKKIMELVRVRATGKPLAQIFGNVDFRGYKILVSDKVLSPRMETEILTETAMNEAGGNVGLELCTGSGAVAVCLALSGKTMTASDISPNAVSLAKRNAENLGADLTVLESDMFEKIEGKFDFIVCNPPYIRSKEIPTLAREVKDFEPRIALDGGEDGLKFYRIIASEASKHLNSHGKLFLEVGEDEAQEVEKLLAGEFAVKIVKDLDGFDRIVVGELNV